MSRFIHGIVIAATPVIIGIFGTITVPAVGSPSCMTQEEARKAFPRDHIYWHGPQRCWDNIGKRRSERSAANVKPSESATAQSEVNTSAESNNKPVESDKPSAPVAAAPVPFIDNDPSRVLSWPALIVPSRAQQDEPPPAPAANEQNEEIVIGAPNAAPGSPDYLLEHCCWPPSSSDTPRDDALLRNMVIASTSACGLAVGLWLLVYRRRQPVRARWS